MKKPNTISNKIYLLILIISSSPCSSHILFNPLTYLKFLVAALSLNGSNDLSPQAFDILTGFTPWAEQSRQKKNNCYNYATRQFTDTFAQPGRAYMIDTKGIDPDFYYVPNTCEDVKQGAINDGLVALASANSTCKGHRVFLTINPGKDFHWYREEKTTNGKTYWRHKQGRSKPIGYDHSGRRIKEISTANYGKYQPCAYFCVHNSKVKIR